MGGRYSKLEEERRKGVEIIDCGGHISVADIQRVAKEKDQKLSESSKKVFRRAAMLVAKCDDYIFRDCELRLVDGLDLYVIFAAGTGGNNYLVITNDNDEAEEVCKARSFERVFWEGVFSIYTSAMGWLARALQLVGNVTVLAVEAGVKKALKM